MEVTMNKRDANFFSFTSVLGVIALIFATGNLPAQAAPAIPNDRVGIVVPGYGPGVAGHVTLSPTVPVCQINLPCDRPYDGAIVQILDANRSVVGTTVTNINGAFIVGLPPGDYIAHIMTVDFPRCPEANVTVGKMFFTLTSIVCDTLIR